MTAFTDPDGADADQRLARLSSTVVSEFRANAGRRFPIFRLTPA